MSRISKAKFLKMRPYFQVCNVDDVLTTDVICNFDEIRFVKQVTAQYTGHEISVVSPAKVSYLGLRQTVRMFQHQT
jgi:hypothetical protein